MGKTGRGQPQSLLILALLLVGGLLQVVCGDAVLTISGVPSPTVTPAATIAAAQVQTTPAASSTPAATPASTPTTTPAVTTASTPAATPAATTASTPAATTASTPAATVASTPAASVTSTPAASALPVATVTPNTTASSSLATESNATTANQTTTAQTPAASLSNVTAPATNTTRNATTAVAPAASSPVTAPSPAVPTNPNDTALTATLQLQGANLWPWTLPLSQTVVTSLAQTLTTVTTSGINIINVTEANSRRLHRSLLQTNETVNVNMELEGSSPQAALSINTDLGNNVLSGALQNTMARNGLVLSGLSLTYSDAIVPEANIQCASGSYQLTCINALSPKWSTGKIVGVAVGAGVGALLLLLLCVVCTLRCVNKARTQKAKAMRPRRAMTPQYAQPFWETNQKKEENPGAISLTASAADPLAPTSLPLPAVNPGTQYAEEREMGGRSRRDQLGYRLPEFAARTKPTQKGPDGKAGPSQAQTSEP